MRETGSEPPSDEVLAARAAAGSEEALEELVRRWSGPVLAYCRRRARPPLEAEDLCQQVLVAVVRRFGRWRPGRPFAPWLFAVARSVVIDAVGAAARRVPEGVGGAEGVADGQTPADTAAAREAESDLWRRARQVLSPRQFEALDLRIRAGLPVTAIATAMGLTRTHVRVLLFRARQSLLAAGADRALREAMAAEAEPAPAAARER